MSILTLPGRWYRPKSEARPIELIRSEEHFLFSQGLTTVYGCKVEEKLKVNVTWRDKQGYWHTDNRQNIPLKSLDFYDLAERHLLPWNNGEKWYSQSPWANLPLSVICSLAFDFAQLERK